MKFTDIEDEQIIYAREVQKLSWPRIAEPLGRTASSCAHRFLRLKLGLKEMRRRRSKPQAAIHHEERICLGCGKKFLSRGIGNRQCISCASRSDDADYQVGL